MKGVGNVGMAKLCFARVVHSEEQSRSLVVSMAEYDCRPLISCVSTRRPGHTHQNPPAK